MHKSSSNTRLGGVGKSSSHIRLGRWPKLPPINICSLYGGPLTRIRRPRHVQQHRGAPLEVMERRQRSRRGRERRVNPDAFHPRAGARVLRDRAGERVEGVGGDTPRLGRRVEFVLRQRRRAVRRQQLSGGHLLAAPVDRDGRRRFLVGRTRRPLPKGNRHPLPKGNGRSPPAECRRGLAPRGGRTRAGCPSPCRAGAGGPATSPRRPTADCA